MQLRTLGGLALEGSGFSRPKPLLLLAYLALEGGKDRRHLAELFWPEAADPMHSLRTALTQLRRSTTEAVKVDEARLNTTVSCDARELLESLDRGELDTPPERYPGPFLEGFYLQELGAELEEWIYATREFVAARVREGLLRLAERQMGEGHADKAGEYAGLAYALAGAPALDPEDFTRVYRLLLAGGSPRARELRLEARSFALDLSSSIGTQPSTDELEARPFAVRHNLPTSRTSFVGRDLELVEIANLLLGKECRLLTLLGPGGTGKTRLALRAGQEVIDQGAFPDGVFFVPLDVLADPKLVPSTIANALEVPLLGSAEPLAQILAALKDKRALLILDNFEQLTSGAPLASKLLEGCPRLKLLVTSRERLNLAEEWTYLVEGFPVPDEPTKNAELSDALKLFMHRAKRLQLDFDLTPEALPHTHRICRLVDGSPLGIELAATWIRVMPVGDIAAELARSFDLLETAERNVFERQRSIRATFEYSWRLLGPREQEALRKLSVFVGGFTREAASLVADASISVLAGLVNKSLVRPLPNGRYDQHPLLQQYPREKLLEREDELSGVRHEHAQYFLNFVEEAAPKLRGEAQALWLEKLGQDLDNVRAALRWLKEHDRTTALKMAVLLEPFWSTWGRCAEGRELLKPLLAPEPQVPEALIGRAYRGLGTMAFEMGDYEEAKTYCGKALEIARTLGDKQLASLALAGLGWTASAERRYEQALALLEEGLALGRANSDRWMITWMLGSIGFTLSAQGRPVEAKSYYEESLILMRETGDRRGVAFVLNGLGVVASKLDDDALERRYYDESLQLKRELGDKRGIASTLVELGGLAAKRGAYAEAEALYCEGLTLRCEVGHLRGASQILDMLGDLARRVGDFGGARSRLKESLQIQRRLGEKDGIAAALQSLAVVTVAQGDHMQAARVAGAAEALLDASEFTVFWQSRPEGEHLLHTALTALGEEAFEKARWEGRRLSLDEVMAYLC